MQDRQERVNEVSGGKVGGGEVREREGEKKAKQQKQNENGS